MRISALRSGSPVMPFTTSPDSEGIGSREFLSCKAAGCAAGGLGLYSALSLAADVYGGHPLALRPTHFEAKAKHLLFIFLSGGFSHVDTFDYKPQLTADHGKSVPSVELRGTSVQPLMG